MPFSSKNSYNKDDITAIISFLNNNNVLSYYGDEGLQRTYEDEIKNYLGTKHVVLVNSGTNALFAAYFALGIMPGDEVIVPAFSFFAIASPLLLLHANIVMADCSSDTGLISVQDVMDKVSSKTKAVVVNHIAGDSIDMQFFVEEMHKLGIAVIEDLSLAFGGEDHGHKLGSFGDLTCCSLGSTKMLSGGQGGFVSVNNREYYERIVMLGCFGKRAYQNVINPFYRQFVNVSYGLNIRMQSIAIAVSYGRFQRLEKLIQMRHERYNMLSQCISNHTSIISPPRSVPNKFRGSWHGYYALCNEDLPEESRAHLVDVMNAAGLMVTKGAHYPLLHKEKLYYALKDGIYRTNNNPFKTNEHVYFCNNAVQYNNHIISFPLFLDENINFVESYCNKLNDILTHF